MYFHHQLSLYHLPYICHLPHTWHLLFSFFIYFNFFLSSICFYLFFCHLLVYICHLSSIYLVRFTSVIFVLVSLPALESTKRNTCQTLCFQRGPSGPLLAMLVYSHWISTWVWNAVHLCCLCMWIWHVLCFDLEIQAYSWTDVRVWTYYWSEIYSRHNHRQHKVDFVCIKWHKRESEYIKWEVKSVDGDSEKLRGWGWEVDLL